MARYVAVSVYEWDKTVKDGPFEFDDPSEWIAQEGQRLMPEEVALAAGYHFAADGAFAAPVDPSGPEPSHGKQHGHGHDEHGHDHGRDKHGK
ncbi:hypothetical protein ACWD7Y_04410 [Streptomyces drozdowiczii]